MLQVADLEEYSVDDIENLLNLIQPILSKRRALHEKYSRGASQSRVMFSGDEESTKLPFEKFITDLATGYTAGKPTYNVEVSQDEKKNKVLKNLLDKEPKDEEYADGMKILIDYISGYNDDGQETYDLIHDIFELTSCYEVVYENEDNEIIYSKYDPLQTVATWDYKIPSNLTGLVRTWEETDLDGNIVTKVELTDKNGIRIYDYDGTDAVLTEEMSHNWNDVPAIAVETDFAIFETCEDIISAYEQLIQNMRNTFQYNDTDCKLKISGYAPENPMTVVDDNGNVVVNPARAKEDDAVLSTKTFYVSEGGDIDWISKPVDSGGVETILTMYQDLMFQLAGIPNTTDLAFNSADLNASAIDRKFYIMNMATVSAVSQLKKALLRRWELIFGRINIKKQTDFDFRDIEIDIPKNLPANDSELADQMIKLRDLISDETIVETLGYNYLSEREKMDDESADKMMMSMERMKAQGGMDEQGRIDKSQMGESGERVEEKPTENRENLREESGRDKQSGSGVRNQ